MIRKAVYSDADAMEEIYEEHFAYEETHTKYTVYKRGVYPTRATREKAYNDGNLYIYEDGGAVAHSGHLFLEKKL